MNNFPELRFSGFDGEWKNTRLRSLCTLITKGTTPQAFSRQGVNFIKIECLIENEFSISKCLFVDDQTHSKYLKRSILEEDDILFAIAGATVGKIGIVKKEILPANTNQAFAIIRLENKKLLRFVFYILQSQIMKIYIQQQISVGAQPNLNLAQIGNFEFSSGTTKEQQKIADFLYSVDNKTSLLTEKHSLLQRYKKGVMQKLFSQELRFKDDLGNDFPDWERSTLGKISSKSDYGMNKAAVEFDGNSKYIRITDIDDITRKFTPRPLVSPSGGQDDNYKVKYGDILFARTGASVGKSYLYDDEDGNLFFAGFLIRFSITEADPYFIFQQTKGHKFDKWVRVMSMRSGQPGINANEYASFEILLPELKEQQKIANFLSKIDKKIDSVTQQIEQTKAFKKGLLQKMFV